MPSSSRRTFLLATAAVGAGSLAGCFSRSCSPRRTQHNSDVSLSGDVRWPTQYYDAANTSYNPSADGPTAGVQVSWRYTLCGPSEASTIVSTETTHLEHHVIDTQTGENADEWTFSRSTPTINDGMTYSPVGGADVDGPQLQARDATSGEVRWMTGLPRYGYPSSPTVANETVYTAAGDLFAMDRETGEERWRFEIPSEVDAVGPPAVREQTVYVADDDRTVYAVEAETGDERWRITPTQEGGPSPIPSVANGLVYIVINSDENSELKAVIPADGSVVWRHETKLSLYSPVAITERSVFVVGSDYEQGFVMALDPETGEQQWQEGVDNSRYLGTVAVGGENVYAGAINEVDTAPVYALDQATGEQQWQFETRPRDFGDYTRRTVSAIAAVGEYVFVTTSGEVYALVGQS